MDYGSCLTNRSFSSYLEPHENEPPGWRHFHMNAAVFRTKTRFDEETKGNSEMVFFFATYVQL